MKRKILFICGSLNQTTMMHQISQELHEYDNYFTPYYADGFINILQKNGLLDFTILGGKFRENTEKYLKENDLTIDYEGSLNDYDLVFTCSDLIVPKNIRNKRLILVQEGMTDPPSILNNIVKTFKLPRWIAGTSTNGQSDAYDIFCVASEGYKNFFVQNGIDPDKIRVTGIPNYDNAIQYCDNDFQYRNFVLVATSDARETFIYDNRKKFIVVSFNIAK
jgi:galactitol-specific phosphotransferase system IIB component